MFRQLDSACMVGVLDHLGARDAIMLVAADPLLYSANYRHAIRSRREQEARARMTHEFKTAVRACELLESGLHPPFSWNSYHGVWLENTGYVTPRDYAYWEPITSGSRYATKQVQLAPETNDDEAFVIELETVVLWHQTTPPTFVLAVYRSAYRRQKYERVKLASLCRRGSSGKWQLTKLADDDSPAAAAAGPDAPLYAGLMSAFELIC